MVTYTFNLDKFRKHYGSPCPCMLITEDMGFADILLITCPCAEFMDTGVCRCGLFKEI